MGYLVTVSFDLSNASSEDYEVAYAELAFIGLYKQVLNGNGEALALPTTTCVGDFSGTSAESVRDHVRQQIDSAFNVHAFEYEIFVSVGGDWAWYGSLYLA